MRQADAQAVHSLIENNRSHLDRWLRWSSGLRPLEDVEAFIAQFEAKEASNDGFHLGIWDGRSFAGGAVCWYINRQNRNCEIGYWLGESFTGRGIATRASQGRLWRTFSKTRGSTGSRCNAASRMPPVGRWPNGCGLRQEGIRRESHWITNRFVDHVVYGILDAEWDAMAPNRTTRLQ